MKFALAISNSSFARSTSFSTPTSTRSASTAAITSSTKTNNNNTCPATFAPGFPVEFMTFSTRCQEFSASLRDNLYGALANTCLASFCNTQWTSTINSYVSAGIQKTTTSTRTYFEGIYGTGSLSTKIVTQTYWTQTFTFVVPPPKAITMAKPCCGHCTISAATVQLYFWPETTQTVAPVVPGLPPNTTAKVSGLPINGSGNYVDDSGFTFVSPSIYIGFTSLGAHDGCGTLGTPLYNTTMAFDPSEISSILPLQTTATCAGVTTYPDGTSRTTTGIEVEVPSPLPLTYADVAQNCKLALFLPTYG